MLQYTNALHSLQSCHILCLEHALHLDTPVEGSLLYQQMCSRTKQPQLYKLIN